MTNKERYRKFCTTNKTLPVFVKDWYLDAVCEGGEWDVALVQNDGEVYASMPYFIKQKFGFQYIAMPHFVKSMGPYILPKMRTLKQEHALMKALIEQLPKVDCLKQDFHYSIKNWLPFYWEAYQQTTRYTYLLSIDSLDKVYNKLKSSRRRSIKKSKERVKVVHDLSAEQLYEVNKKSFERQGATPPYSKELFLKVDRVLAEHEARQLFFAVDEQGSIHSVAYLIWDEHSSYYHIAGDDPDLRKSDAGILLIWSAIVYTKEELGLNLFDFEGSMLQNVEAIRREFGARQQAYSRIWKYNSNLYWLLDRLQGNI